MKKNRPATLVSILCEKTKREILTELLYTETSTLGVRVSEIERDCLRREIVQIETEFGKINVKIAKLNGKIVNAKPEYDQIRKIALQSKKSLREIEREILQKLN
jgi:pyridinium-3,5-bisthiocarboxylic acid mononucleotide nickel chelatase